MNKITRIISISVLLLFTLTALASQKAITDKGDVVILKDNGSWKYESDIKNVKKISTNDDVFKKSAEATFELKSTTTDVSVFLNPSLWSFKKGEDDVDSGEYSFSNKAGNVFGKLITEKIELTLEQLTDIALINAQDFSPDIRVTKKEYRTVNNQKIIFQEMKGSSKGLDFTYFGYYFSNKSGVNQFITYTLDASINKEVLQEVEAFLNGLSISSEKSAANKEKDNNQNDSK